jgi:hypothetical protein
MKMEFLPKGDPECVRWVPVKEADAGASTRPSEPAVQDALGQSEALLG